MLRANRRGSCIIIKPKTVGEADESGYEGQMIDVSFFLSCKLTEGMSTWLQRVNDRLRCVFSS